MCPLRSLAQDRPAPAGLDALVSIDGFTVRARASGSQCHSVADRSPMPMPTYPHTGRQRAADCSKYIIHRYQAGDCRARSGAQARQVDRASLNARAAVRAQRSHSNVHALLLSSGGTAYGSIDDGGGNKQTLRHNGPQALPLLRAAPCARYGSPTASASCRQALIVRPSARKQRIGEPPSAHEPAPAASASARPTDSAEAAAGSVPIGRGDS